LFQDIRKMGRSFLRADFFADIRLSILKIKRQKPRSPEFIEGRE
jgi:hypothetical protein